ncbi:MAG: hypothetical protein U9Q71_06130 [Pseudomonadota bacterium]|nr:hypothetical protein [Pseudomonadota bacterium]
MRENFTSGSYGEGLETGPRNTLNGHEGGNPGHSQGSSYGLPRQSFTRQSGFKELKQEIGSARSQTRNAEAVINHLNFCMMAATVTWIYADRIQADPQRRHLVKGRTSFAFSDVRRLITNAALSEDFLGLWPSPRKPRQNPFVSLLMRMVA